MWGPKCCSERNNIINIKKTSINWGKFPKKSNFSRISKEQHIYSSLITVNIFVLKIVGTFKMAPDIFVLKIVGTFKVAPDVVSEYEQNESTGRIAIDTRQYQWMIVHMRQC